MALMAVFDPARLSTLKIGFDLPYLLGEWRAMFRPSTMMKDVWAGVTVALVALPLNLALAIAAGVEPGVGITTGIVAGIVAGLFGGQRVAVTGPAAAMAVVLIEIAQAYGIAGIWLVGLIAGAMQMLAGALRLGRLISYIPMPVMVGFANAIGILVFFNALDDFLGLPTKPIAHPGQAAPLAAHAFIPEFIQDISHLFWRLIMHGEINPYAVTLGFVAFGIAVLTPKYTKAVPGQLAAIIVATVACTALRFPVPRIAHISTIPNTLPLPQIPSLPWDQLDNLFASAVTVFMLGSIESLLSASVADGMTMSKRHHSDQELIGQGMANMVVPFFGGIPVTGVIARTAVNIRAGAQTRLAAVVHSIALTILIFFLARSAEQIPLAALAAILVLTGIRLIEWDEVREIWRASRMEGYVMLVTTVVSVVMDLTAGVITGLIFTCGLFIKQMGEVRLVPAAEESEEEAGVAAGIPSCKFVRTYLVDGPLFFGAAERFIENILIVEDLKILILRMRAVTVMDLTGVETLLSIGKQLHRKGATLMLAELPSQPRQLLERTKATEEIGEANMFSNYQDALIEANKRMLEAVCRGCADPKGRGGRPDCRLRAAILTDSPAVARMFAVQDDHVVCLLKTAPHEIERLIPVDSVNDIPFLLRNTPVETLLKSHNLNQMDGELPQEPQLLIGMCIDYRHSLVVPKEFAYVIRREGANMQGAEFTVALALLNGVKCMALIGHNGCALTNSQDVREEFVKNLTREHGWAPARAFELFDKHARSKEVDSEIDFVLQEAQRLSRLFRGLTVVPLFYRSENERLYLIREWLGDTGTWMVTREMPALRLDKERLGNL